MDSAPAPSDAVSSGPVPASSQRMDALSLPLPAVTALPAVPAAEELLQREEAALRRVIQRYVRDAATVDDVYQEVSLKVLRRLESVRDPAAVRGWLFQLAR